jgi:CDP-glucose 4,6-dehydratase
MESMERLRSNLKGNKILVTGGAGFIGSHLTQELITKGYKVIVVDIKKPGKTYFFINKLDKKADYQRIDITNRKKISLLFNRVKPDFVIHLAAVSIVDEAYDNPHKTFMTNVMGTVNILEECRKVKNLKGVIVASSDKAYGKTKKAYTENTPLHGDHPYDVSKSCEDLIAQTYYKTYGLPTVVVRTCNIYGEGDLYFDRIIPGICKSVITKKPLKIRSDGKYIRDYMYVADAVSGYIFILNHFRKMKGGAYNFSSRESFSVLDLIKKTEKTINQKIPHKIINIARNEIPYQRIDDRKVRKLGWKSKYYYKNVIMKILKWYRECLTQG